MLYVYGTVISKFNVKCLEYVFSNHGCYLVAASSSTDFAVRFVWHKGNNLLCTLRTVAVLFDGL